MITQIDLNILDFIQSLRTTFADGLFVFITHLGDGGYLWIATALIMLFFKKTRKCGIMLAMVLITGHLLGNMFLKNVIARPRPFVINPQMAENILISLPHSYSFPSGHTMSSFECATAIFLCHRKAGIGALILALLIGFTRNYLYVHYPTDVLVGAILGIVVAVVMYFIYNKFIENKIKIGKISL